MALRGGTYNRGTQSLQHGGGHARYDIAGRRLGVEMSESQIVGFLGRKIWQAMNDEDGDLSDVRQENFNYYVGQEYGDERTGYSAYVTREVLETVEWVLPSVLRVFLADTERVVEFDAVGPDDEEAAKQETDITNHFVMKANGGKGFLSLHHWFKDALMFPNGYIKAWVEEKIETDVGNLTGITAEGVQMLVDNPDVEILEQESRMVMVEQPAPPPQTQPGQPPPPPTNAMIQVPTEVFDLRVRHTKDVKRLRVDPLPGEEALIDNDTVSIDLNEADFVCHRVRKSYTQLVLEGYDAEELDQVGLGEDYQWNDERTNRLFFEDEDPDAEDEDDPSMRTFWVHECYAWFDFDGDGIGEHRRVILIGDRVFENEETNYQPLVALSSILMQHKHNGMSYADIVKDLQLLLSTLTRELLDNVYKINIRRKVFSEDALTEDGSTMDAMLNTQAEFIPVRGPAQNAFVPEPTHSIVGELLPVIQHFREERAFRSGVNPENSLDPNVLQESTVGAFMGALEQASQRIEMLVRIFAETGIRFLFLKVHQLLRSHWDLPQTVKIRGKWVTVDPQGWRERTDMTVNTGLGYNNKTQTMALLVQLLSMQKEAVAAGLSSPEKIYNALRKIVTASGIGNPNEYFIDPNSPEYVPPQPPPPDPNMILAQAQAQALGQEQQRKGMEAQAKVQHDQQKTQIDGAKGMADVQLKQAELRLKEREIALREMELEHKHGVERAEIEARIENVREDSDLKRAQSAKTRVEGMQTAVETGETVQEARRIVEENGNGDNGERAETESGGGEVEIDAEYEQ